MVARFFKYTFAGLLILFLGALLYAFYFITRQSDIWIYEKMKQFSASQGLELKGGDFTSRVKLSFSPLTLKIQDITLKNCLLIGNLDFPRTNSGSAKSENDQNQDQSKNQGPNQNLNQNLNQNVIRGLTSDLNRILNQIVGQINNLPIRMEVDQIKIDSCGIDLGLILKDKATSKSWRVNIQKFSFLLGLKVLPGEISFHIENLVEGGKVGLAGTLQSNLHSRHSIDLEIHTPSPQLDVSQAKISGETKLTNVSYENLKSLGNISEILIQPRIEKSDKDFILQLEMAIKHLGNSLNLDVRLQKAADQSKIITTAKGQYTTETIFPIILPLIFPPIFPLSNETPIPTQFGNFSGNYFLHHEFLVPQNLDPQKLDPQNLDLQKMDLQNLAPAILSSLLNSSQIQFEISAHQTATKSKQGYISIPKPLAIKLSTQLTENKINVDSLQISYGSQKNVEASMTAQIVALLQPTKLQPTPFPSIQLQSIDINALAKFEKFNYHFEWQDQKLSIQNMTGHIPLQESLTLSNSNVNFQKLFNVNSFLKTSFEKIKHVLPHIQPIEIKEFNYQGKSFGPLKAYAEISQNVFSLHQMVLDLPHGQIAGEIHSDFNPKKPGIAFLIRGVHLVLDDFIPKGKHKLSNDPLTFRTSSSFFLDSSNLEGETLITQLGGSQLISLINFLDPEYKNVNLIKARELLKVGYPTYLRTAYSKGYLDMDVHINNIRLPTIRGILIAPWVYEQSSKIKDLFHLDKESE